MSTPPPAVIEPTPKGDGHDIHPIPVAQADTDGQLVDLWVARHESPNTRHISRRQAEGIMPEADMLRLIGLEANPRNRPILDTGPLTTALRITNHSKQCFERTAEHGLHPPKGTPEEVEGSLPSIEGSGQKGECDEGGHAPAWDDPVIDLEHVEGAREIKNVDNRAEQGETDQGSAVGTQHECRAYVRRLGIRTR